MFTPGMLGDVGKEIRDRSFHLRRFLSPGPLLRLSARAPSFWWLIILLGIPVASEALEIAAGTRDFTFNPGLPPTFSIQLVRPLPNQGVVLAGTLGSKPALAVLTPEGVWDRSVSLDGSVQGGITDVYATKNGGFLIAGLFTKPSATCILKLSADGGLDPGFHSPTADGEARLVAESPTGAILISGPFATIAGSKRVWLALLNQDGSLNAEFDPRASISGTDPSLTAVRTILALDDGSFLVGGRFLKYQGQRVPGLVKLRADANAATDFFPELAPSSITEINRPNALARQRDGRIILLGTFVRGDYRNARLIRMDTTGKLDYGFGPSMVDWTVNSSSLLIVDPQDRLVVGNGIFRRELPDGKPDAAFWDDRVKDGNQQPYSAAPLGTNRLVVLGFGGAFTALFSDPRGAAPSAPSVVSSDGYLYTGSHEGSSVATQPLFLGNPAPSMQWLLNQRPLLNETNPLFAVPWVTRSNMGVLSVVASNAFGVVTQGITAIVGTVTDRSQTMIDPSKSFREIPIAEVQVLRADGAGQMLVGGLRVPFPGRPSVDVVRMDQDRHFDSSFTLQVTKPILKLYDVAQSSNRLIALSASYTDATLRTQQVVWVVDGTGALKREIAVQGGPVMRVLPDAGGGWLLGGDFSALDAAPRPRLARLGATGELLDDFGLGDLPDKMIRSMVETASGKIFIVGDFKQVGTLARSGIALLNGDGKVDTSFDPLAGFDRPLVDVLMPTPDAVWVGGTFTRYQGKVSKGLARLSLTGELLPLATTLSTSTLLTDPQGRIWAGGPTSGIRFLSDGTLDPEARLPRPPPGTPFERAAAFPSGDIVVAGGLTDPVATWREGMAVLMGKDELATEPPKLFGDIVYPDVYYGGAPVVACASGHELTYNWYFGDVLSFSRPDIGFGFIYPRTDPPLPLRAVVVNKFGSVTSAPYVFSTNLPLRITPKPFAPDQLVTPGEPGLWAAETTRPRPPSHLIQWFRGGVPIPSRDGLLFIPEIAPSDAGFYQVVVAGESEAAASGFQLRVPAVRPEVNQALETQNRLYDTGGANPWYRTAPAEDPEGLVMNSGVTPLGGSSWLDLRFFGAGKLTFRWKLELPSGDGIALCSLNGFELARLVAPTGWVETTVSPGAAAAPPSLIRWSFINQGPRDASSGRLLLDWVKITDGYRPSVQVQPESATVESGQPALLTPVVQVSPPASFQWFHDGVVIPGATLPYLSIAHVTPDLQGSFTLTVTNAFGGVATAAAKVLLRVPLVQLTWTVNPESALLHLETPTLGDATVLLEVSSDLLTWETFGTFPSGTATRSLDLPIELAVAKKFIRARIP